MEEKPLQLLKLPQVVIAEIIRMKSPLELVLLMSLSERAKHLVKFHTKKLQIALKIWIIRNDLQLLVSRQEEMHPHYLHTDGLISLGEHLPICNDDLTPEALKIVHALHFAAIYQWITLIKEVFEIEVCGVTLFFSKDALIDRTLNLLRRMGIKASIELMSTDSNVEASRALLARCSSAFDYSIVSGMPGRDFSFTGFDLYAMNELTICYSQWVTIENLCSLRNCLKVKLMLSFFKSEELNYFLKKWVEESKIRYVHMPYANERMRNEDHIIFNGLKTYSDGEVVDGRKLHLQNRVFVIRRKCDGVFAKVTTFDKYFILETENSGTCTPFFI